MCVGVVRMDVDAPRVRTKGGVEILLGGVERPDRSQYTICADERCERCRGVVLSQRFDCLVLALIQAGQFVVRTSRARKRRQRLVKCTLGVRVAPELNERVGERQRRAFVARSQTHGRSKLLDRLYEAAR